jgi:putative SOS response-associated peptidase YedK
MCGRFTLRARLNAIAKAFEVFDVPELPPRYNVAPTQQVLAIRAADGTGKREAALLRWGLVPAWAQDVKIGNTMITPAPRRWRQSRPSNLRSPNVVA